MADETGLAQWAPFELMEKIEDEAILAEIKGEVLKDLVYSFTDSSGRKVEGLSKAGVDAVVAELARRGEAIRELDLQWTEDEKSYKATVRAGRYAISRVGQEVLLDSAFGAKRQPKFLITRDGKEIENPFSFELAIVKAARNAKRRLIPESLAVEMIERAKTEGKSRNVPPTYPKSESKPAKAAPARIQAPPSEEEIIKKLRQQVGIEAGKVFKTDEERKAWQKKEYNVDSMTELPKEQLQDMLEKVILLGVIPIQSKPAAAPSKPTPEELGFSSQAEQGQMRKELFSLITGLGLKTDVEKSNYAAQKGWGKTSEVTKETLASYLEEVNQEAASVKKAEDIPEGI